MSASKHCTVAYATRERQYLWTVVLPAAASIADALATARAGAAAADARSAAIPWETAAVGIFGELRRRSDVVADGDRIELYRPLRGDPRERRRARVQQERGERRPRSARRRAR